MGKILEVGYNGEYFTLDENQVQALKLLLKQATDLRDCPALVERDYLQLGALAGELSAQIDLHRVAENKFQLRFFSPEAAALKKYIQYQVQKASSSNVFVQLCFPDLKFCASVEQQEEFWKGFVETILKHCRYV